LVAFVFSVLGTSGKKRQQQPCSRGVGMAARCAVFAKTRNG